jgi:hypothetical protein
MNDIIFERKKHKRIEEIQDKISYFIIGKNQALLYFLF